MSDDLVAFLRARLDEDEQAAAAASDGPWTPWRGSRVLHGLGDLQHAVTLPGQGPGSRASIVTASWLDAEHIARHDPARVLAEVAFKRELITLWETAKRNAALPNPEGVPVYYPAAFVNGCASALGYAIKLAAAPYAAVEGYRPEWAPDAR